VALVRVFFRDLYSLVELDDTDKIEDEKRGENDMANGLSRSDKYHSNISFSSPVKNNTEGREKVNREKTKKLVMK
jgi:hypothetical protein